MELPGQQWGDQQVILIAGDGEGNLGIDEETARDDFIAGGGDAVNAVALDVAGYDFFGCFCAPRLSSFCCGHGFALPGKVEVDRDDYKHAVLASLSSDGVCDDADCNSNGISDYCDLSEGTSPDCNTNQIPDECDPDVALRIIYVDASASGTGDGQTWENAYLELRDGVDDALAAPCLAEIWVAGNATYTPDPDGIDRDRSFEWVGSVRIYGGFPPGGSEFTGRSPADYPTILSGDIRIPGEPADNSHHVVTVNNITRYATLDGVFVTAGRADNQGGGLFNEAICSSPSFANCTFFNNAAQGSGGGVYHSPGNPRFANCIFDSNVGDCGGGLYTQTGYPTVSGCQFISNTAAERGGGLAHDGAGGPELSGCTFRANIADHGGGLFSEFSSDPSELSSHPALLTCTFLGNQTSSGSGRGGAVYAGPITIEDCEFIGNDAAYGGAAEIQEGLVARSLFIDNEANFDGGALRRTGDATLLLESLVLAGNNANRDGGCIYSLYYEDPIPTADASVTSAANCLFVGNTAQHQGGACYIASTDIYTDYHRLTNCTFHDNWAPELPTPGGSAIYAGTQAHEGALYNCLVWSRTDDAYLIFYTPGAQPDMYNCDVHYPTREYEGVCLVNEDPQFVGGPAGDWSGGVARVYDPETGLTHIVEATAVWAGQQVTGLFLKPDAEHVFQTLIAGHTDTELWVWGDVEAYIAEGGGGSYEIIDYRLGIGSPCIDAGSNDEPPEVPPADLAGLARRWDAPSMPDCPLVGCDNCGDAPVIDIGAYENQPAQCAILAVSSCRDHDLAGRLCLEMDLSGGIESRLGGISELDLTIDDPGAFAGGVTVDCAPCFWSGSANTIVNGTVITALFSPALPDQCCCTVTLDCDAGVCVCRLDGDINRNGLVAISDASIIKPKFGDTPTDATAEFDFYVDGLISMSDFSQVKPYFGNGLVNSCP
jgi:hypothetical protein